VFNLVSLYRTFSRLLRKEEKQGNKRISSLIPTKISQNQTTYYINMKFTVAALLLAPAVAFAPAKFGVTSSALQMSTAESTVSVFFAFSFFVL
jgi:hypothetical protein